MDLHLILPALGMYIPRPCDWHVSLFFGCELDPQPGRNEANGWLMINDFHNLSYLIPLPHHMYSKSFQRKTNLQIFEKISLRRSNVKHPLPAADCSNICPE